VPDPALDFEELCSLGGINAEVGREHDPCSRRNQFVTTPSSRAELGSFGEFDRD
jgi:hypothetical protein